MLFTSFVYFSYVSVFSKNTAFFTFDAESWIRKFFVFTLMGYA